MVREIKYKDCNFCKKNFSNQFGTFYIRGASWDKRKYCSRKCMGATKVKKVVLTCKYCKKKYQEIVSRKHRSTTCSRQCADLKRRNRKIVNCRNCNKQTEVRVSNLNRRFGIYCNNLCFYEDLSKRYKGENGPGWKGGINTEHQIIRHSAKYRKWRKKVFERDDYTCQLCNIKGEELQADHIKPFALFPELRFDINNGRTLCVSCHRKTDTWGVNSKYQQLLSLSSLSR